MRIAIVGAGIGGLTAALACHAAGLDVTLHEQAPLLEAVGAGIQLGPNAMRVLGRLGLTDALMAVGVAPQEIRLRTAIDGNVVAVRPLGAASESRYGAPYLHIHRGDLQVALLAEVHARGIPLRLGRRLSTLSQANGRVQIELAGNHGERLTREYDVCIGADGIHSRVRAALFDDTPPTFTGNVAYRATVPTAALPAELREPVATVWMGDGAHLVQYLVRGGELMNIVAIHEDTRWTRERWQDAGDPAALRMHFAGWHAHVRTLLAAVTECHLWALCDRPPMPQWSRDNCTLLGDACHPMLPFLAQGAAMAIEDAWVLSRALATPGLEPASALRRYETARRARTARVQAEARSQATLFHLPPGIASGLRNLVLGLGSRLLPGVAMARYDWLYGHDVLDAPLP